MKPILRSMARIGGSCHSQLNLPVGMIVVWLLAITAGFTGQEARQQSEDQPKAPGVLKDSAEEGQAIPSQNRTFQEKGTEGCDQCHYIATPRVSSDFVMLTESRHFLEHDKHSQAAQLLKGAQARRIGELLNIPNVSENRACLSCHANWKNADKPIEWQKGVNCEACHGPSSAWEAPHAKKTWRLMSPEQKEDLGFVDVRDPVKRAEQCFGCHIGNVKEGKVVTHAMYAAGHPPLPGIEIESFANQMSAHWRTIHEKGPFEHRETYQKLNDCEGTGAEFLPRTRNVIVGGLVALRESLTLVADQSKIGDAPNGDSATGNESWPELAAFDCQACHHELRTPSWRQERNPLVAPGRPSLPEWPFTLVEVGLQQIAEGDAHRLKTLQDEFQQHRTDLYTAFQKQPFGNRELIAVASKRFLSWLDAIIKTASSSQFHVAAAKRAKAHLLKLEPREFPDFHSARQRIWALGVITEEIELTATPLTFAPAPAQETETSRRQRETNAILQVLKWRESTVLPIRQRWLTQWSASQDKFQLPLELPAGPGKLDPNEIPEERIVETMPQSLNAISKYDANQFRAALERLRSSQAPKTTSD